MNDTESTVSTTRRRWALAVPAAGLAFETFVLALARTTAYELPFRVTAAFWAYWALPFVLTGALIWYAAPRTKPGWTLATVLGIVLALSGVGGYVQLRLAPDASFIGLSGPLVQLAAVVVVGAVVLVMASRSGGHRRHRWGWLAS